VTSFSDLITFLPVRDLAAAHDFYAGALDLELVLDQGSCRI
jgi:catechol 2,3-dioxygenase-like lactoylglutathione lyase family enzyme